MILFSDSFHLNKYKFSLNTILSQPINNCYPININFSNSILFIISIRKTISAHLSQPINNCYPINTILPQTIIRNKYGNHLLKLKINYTTKLKFCLR